MFRRFGISSRTQRITLSLIALGLALLISFLRDGDFQSPADAGASLPIPSAQSTPKETAARTVDAGTAQAETREQAVAQAIRWLEAQEGGAHNGHAIARHVGKSEQDLRDRIARDGVGVASAFYDLETAAVAIVRTIRHKPNDAEVRRWLGADDSRRRLALRRIFDKPIGLVVRRNGAAEDGRTAITVLTKRQVDGRPSYSLLTAYVEP